MTHFIIVKSDGRTEPFSLEKYKRSLQRANISQRHIKEVIKKIKPFLKEGMTTQQLYKKTFALLKGLERVCASRYSLKEALRLLGPSGFPFEILVSMLLQIQGYKTKLDQFLDGKCVRHEFDVLAYKDGACTMVECKFHNKVGIKSDVKITLYMKARFDDVAKVTKKVGVCLIATNTQFTSQAIEYGECVGIQLLAWAYPKNNGIEKLIERNSLYPITVLTHLKNNVRKTLLNAGVIFCKDLLMRKSLLEKEGLSEKNIDDIIGECDALCP